MKILVVSNLYPPHTIGGYEIACRDFSQGLSRLGHQVRVLTSAYQRGGAEKQMGIAIMRGLEFNDPRKAESRLLKKWLGIKSVYWDTRNFFTTYREIKGFNPECVYFWNLSFLSVCPILAAHFAGKKFVFHLEDYWLTAPLRFNEHQNQGFVEENLKKILSLWFPRILQESPFVAVSKHIFDYYTNLGLNADLGEVVYNGLIQSEALHMVDLKRFPANRFLYVGRITKDKGLHLVVEALGKLSEQDSRFELDVAGEYESETYRDQIEQLIEKHKLGQQIRFLGKREHSEVLSLYRKYKLCVVPSVWDEPFGLVVIEAMSQGCVPIVSSAGALPELIEHGQDGFIFERGSSGSLAAWLNQIKPGGLNLLSGRAYQKAIKRFGLSDKVKKVEAFLLTG